MKKERPCRCASSQSDVLENGGDGIAVVVVFQAGQSAGWRKNNGKTGNILAQVAGSCLPAVPNDLIGSKGDGFPGDSTRDCQRNATVGLVGSLVYREGEKFAT